MKKEAHTIFAFRTNWQWKTVRARCLRMLFWPLVNGYRVFVLFSSILYCAHWPSSFHDMTKCSDTCRHAVYAHCLRKNTKMHSNCNTMR